MPDREKVITALQHCIKKPCNTNCPYFSSDDPTQAYCLFNKIMPDALALLKEQEARVMTWDDVLEFAELSDEGYSEKTPCYIEHFEPDQSYIKWCDAETMYRWVNVYITRDSRRRLYNRNDRHGWRCWTSLPSEQQMRETPWEGEKE